MCGNLQCEWDEVCTNTACSIGCAQDCPAYIESSCVKGYDANDNLVSCSGHGTCQATTSVCQCNKGYVGADCSTCETGFILLSTKVCAYLPGSNIQSPTPSPIARIISNGGSTSALAQYRVTIISACAGAGTLATVFVLFVTYLKYRKRAVVVDFDRVPMAPPGQFQIVRM